MAGDSQLVLVETALRQAPTHIWKRSFVRGEAGRISARDKMTAPIRVVMSHNWRIRYELLFQPTIFNDETQWRIKLPRLQVHSYAPEDDVAAGQELPGYSNALPAQEISVYEASIIIGPPSVFLLLKLCDRLMLRVPLQFTTPPEASWRRTLEALKSVPGVNVSPLCRQQSPARLGLPRSHPWTVPGFSSHVHDRVVKGEFLLL
jgi:hypothetical protein